MMETCHVLDTSDTLNCTSHAMKNKTNDTLSCTSHAMKNNTSDTLNCTSHAMKKTILVTHLVVQATP